MALLRDLAHDRVDTETCGETVQGPASSAIMLKTKVGCSLLWNDHQSINRVFQTPIMFGFPI